MDDITDSTDVSLSKLWETVKDEKPGVLWSMESQRARRNLTTEQQRGMEVKFESPSSVSRFPASFRDLTQKLNRENCSHFNDPAHALIS